MDISRQTAPQRHFPNREFPKWTISRTDIRVLEIAVRSGRDRLSRVGGSEIEILLVGGTPPISPVVKTLDISQMDSSTNNIILYGHFPESHISFLGQKMFNLNLT